MNWRSGSGWGAAFAAPGPALMLTHRRCNPFFRFPGISLVVAVLFCVPVLLELGRFGVRSELGVLLEGDQRNLESYEKVQQILAEVEVVVISMELPDLFSPAGIDTVRRVSEALGRGRGVRDVKSLTHSVKPVRRGLAFEMVPLVPPQASEEELRELKEWSLGHPLVRNLMVSADARHTLILVTYQRALGAPAQQRELAVELESALAPFRKEGVGFHTLALPLVQEEVRGTLKGDVRRMVPVAAALLVAVLWMAFRSWRYVGLILFNQLVVLLLLPGTIHLAGFSLTVFSVMLLPLLTGIHLTLLAHVYNSVQRAVSGVEPGRGGEVVERMLDEVFKSCAFAAITTVAGLGSLMLSDVEQVRQFGVMGVIGIGLIFFMTFGPGLALLRLVVGGLGGVGSRAEGSEGAVVGKLAGWVIRRGGLIRGLAVVAVVLGAFGIGMIRTDIRAVEFLSPKSPTRQAVEALDRDYGGINVVQLEIDSGVTNGINRTGYLRYLESVQGYVEGRPEVAAVYSYAQLMAMMNQIWEGGRADAMRLPEASWLLNLFVIALKSQNFPFLTALADEEARVGYLVMRTRDMPAGAYLALINDVVAYAEANRPEGVTVSAAKGIHSILEADRRIVRSQVRTVGVTVFLVGMVLTILWRSVWLALISVVSNAIPVGLVLAAAGFTGVPLNSITVMVGAVALGIAVDDSVHFITHWREGRGRGLSGREAVLDAMKVKGRPIVASSAALIAVFALFALCSFPPVVAFGVLCALAFVGALVSVLVLLPALLDRRG